MRLRLGSVTRLKRIVLSDQSAPDIKPVTPTPPPANPVVAHFFPPIF
jgi:hypothetical protein